MTEKTASITALLVSLITSTMLFVDGYFSRSAIEAITSEDGRQELLRVGFVSLWLPLFLVQAVLLVLIHKYCLRLQSRGVVYVGCIIFIAASLYAYAGYVELKSQI